MIVNTLILSEPFLGYDIFYNLVNKMKVEKMLSTVAHVEGGRANIFSKLHTNQLPPEIRGRHPTLGLGVSNGVHVAYRSLYISIYLVNITYIVGVTLWGCLFVLQGQLKQR